MREALTPSQFAALLSTAELAKFLGVTEATIYGWRSRGGGPPGYRVGRHTRYRPDEVLVWLDERRLARGEVDEEAAGAKEVDTSPAAA